MISNTCSSLFRVFTGEQAQGNLAAVTMLDQFPVNNLRKSATETQVYLAHKVANEFYIQWYQGLLPIKRCGHGTLAATAWLIKNRQNLVAAFNHKIIFHSPQERLRARVSTDGIALNLPVEVLVEAADRNLNFQQIRTKKTKDTQGYLILELKNEKSISEFHLDAEAIDHIEGRALIITSVTARPYADICFRYFAPQYGLYEDQATGSAASIIWPFWENCIGDNRLRCYQASDKGGYYQIRRIDNSIWVQGRVELVSF